MYTRRIQYRVETIASLTLKIPLDLWPATGQWTLGVKVRNMKMDFKRLDALRVGSGNGH